jgi:signal transduction histidine kinase
VTSVSTPWRARLEARLLLFASLVTGLAVAGMLVAANRLIIASAVARNLSDQDSAKLAFDRLIDQRAAFASSQSQLVAELPVFRAHLSDPRIAGDTATIQALAEEYRASLAADFLLVATADGSWVGQSNWPAGPAPAWPTLTGATRRDRTTGSRRLVTLADGVYLVVIEPARFVDEVLGWLATGYRLDDRFAVELAHITGADVNIAASGRLWCSSLPPERRPLMAAAVAGPSLAERDWLDLGATRYSSRHYPLQTIGDAGDASVVMLMDWAPTQELLDQVRRRLLWIGLAAFTLAVVGATVFSRRAARPLRDVVEAAREITHGEWTRRVPVRGTSEAAAMATAFNEMTDSLISLNTQLAGAKERAEQASTAKDQFLANMSHELRTPLNGIMGMTTLTLESGITDEQREYLETIDTSAQALLAIVNDVLDFAKIDAGAMTLDPAPFDLVECVTRTRRLFAPQAQAKGVALVYDIDPALADPLVGDEARLRQVLLNLISNAIKFTRTGRITVQVRRAIGHAGNADVPVTVRVIDTGIGIPHEKLEAIFEPFVQADGSTTRNYGGTGLGLTICSRLIGLMGGRLTVDSEPGVGSTFTFEIHLARAAQPVTAGV